MELIHYADGSILTGTAIARALVDYAQVLASHDAAASVDVPTREEDGSISRATFLLGPASQLVSVAVDSKFDEIVDEHLVQSLREETERQRGAQVRAGDQPVAERPGDPSLTPDLDDIEQFHAEDIPAPE